MQNQPASPANQEPAINLKKTWQEPELVNLSLKTGSNAANNESTFFDLHS